MHRREFLHEGGLAAATLLAASPLRAAIAERLRVVQIGTAHAHAPEKWTTLRRMADFFEVAGIWEPDPGRQARAAREPEYRGARWLTEEQAFGDPSIRAAVVEMELPDQLAMGRRALEAGWSVHLDKPPGADLAALAALRERAVRDGRIIQTGYMLRYHPAFRFCFDAHRRGWLGRLFAVHGEMGKAVAPARRPWLADNYGGSMMLLGCHLLDLALALLGRPERQRAHRRRTFPEHDRYFDHEVAVLEYPRGIATIRSMLAEVGGEDRRHFVVCGDKGTIEIMPLEPARVRLCLQEPAAGFHAGWQDVSLPEPPGRYDAMLRDFAGMVAGRASELPQFNAAHDLLVQEVLLAVAASPADARARPGA